MEEITQSTPQTPPPPKQVSPILTWVLLFILGIAVGLMIDKTILLSALRIPYFSATPTPTLLPTPSPTPDPTVSWKTYTNTKIGFELKYPANYTLLKESPDIVFGFGIGTEPPYPYLIISTISTDYSEYKDCTQNNTSPCLNWATGNQPSGVVDTSLDGKPAKSIYFTVGVDGDYHVIQITNPIKLQLKMYIAGGRLDQTFTQILSTFKFLGQTPTPTCRPRPACLDATPRCMIPETSDMCPPTITPTQKACTLEQKICPDGSYPKRKPNCEWEPCP